MTFIPSTDQSAALDKVNDWLSVTPREKPFFILHGGAGTGKTTIASILQEMHNGPIYPMAYTGKASEVLRSKGFHNAKTIHSTIYLPLSDRNAEAEEIEQHLKTIDPESAEAKKLRRRLAELYSPEFAKNPVNPFLPNSLIVLDECSMVDESLGMDLLSYNVPILILGDPYQLPPIGGAGYFNRKPDFLLTQIHRQAAESPIIRLATMAREGKAISRGDYESSKVIYKREVTKELALGVDQIICGTNKAREGLNKDNREFRGFAGRYPQNGERVICLRNNKKTGVLNGQQFTLATDCYDDVEYDTIMRFQTDDGVERKVHRACFERPKDLVSWDYRRRAMADEFDYAYAITCHKSQGSEWPSVLIWADMFRWADAREDYKKWLYTALTRASDRVVLAL